MTFRTSDFRHPEAECFVPAGLATEGLVGDEPTLDEPDDRGAADSKVALGPRSLAHAIARTTHLAIGAHQDDLEVMAFQGIAECYRRKDRWFGGVVVSDGAGSPREGLYADCSDEEMKAIRAREQKQAAEVGQYSFQALLGYPSSTLQDPTREDVVDDLAMLIAHARPRRIYTHNLADKHPSHLSVVARVIRACRRLPAEQRPLELWGCEVWRDLDWLDDAQKVVMDCSDAPNLAAALIGLFDSQVRGGKRYDLAALGRWRANSTFFASHAVDGGTETAFAMDLSPLLRDDQLEPDALLASHLDQFKDSALRALKKA